MRESDLTILNGVLWKISTSEICHKWALRQISLVEKNDQTKFILAIYSCNVSLYLGKLLNTLGVP